MYSAATNMTAEGLGKGRRPPAIVLCSWSSSPQRCPCWKLTEIHSGHCSRVSACMPRGVNICLHPVHARSLTCKWSHAHKLGYSYSSKVLYMNVFIVTNSPRNGKAWRAHSQPAETAVGGLLPSLTVLLRMRRHSPEPAEILLPGHIT